MHALSLPLQTANFAASIIITKSSKSSANYPNNYSSSPTRNRIVHSNDNFSSVSCRASSSSSYGIKDFDLYDLLGIDSSSDHSKIKAAYRSLQKRCHPDIAGPPGHDMAIILNEAYALLSDPSSRLAYDREQAKMAELRGYTAKPMYSVWLGSESEERAVFVDEVKCIGCLKCALFAEKTFAVESVYGRARVVAQWADPEYKIQEAIDACPVDCILTVERSDLPALEFLMSKQPRGNVRVGTSNTVGARVSNVFEDVKKFKKRHQDAMENSSKQNSKETDIQIEARLSAIQAIRSISNWLYWKTPNIGGSTSNSHQKLLQKPRKTNEPNIEKLRAAAAARKQARESSKPLHQTTSNNYIHDEDYWIPLTLAPPVSKLKKSYSTYVMRPSTSKKIKEIKDKDYTVNQDNEMNPVKWGFPVGPAMIAAVLVRIQLGEEAVGGLEHHMGGSLALQIVNSSWVPVIIAGITWYTIGMMTIGFVQAIRKK